MIRRTSSRPSALAWAAAALSKALDAMKTAGRPWISNQIVSCTLHVVHDPQSARASMTKPHSCEPCRQVALQSVDQYITTWLGDVEQRDRSADRRRPYSQRAFDGLTFIGWIEDLR